MMLCPLLPGASLFALVSFHNMTSVINIGHQTKYNAVYVYSPLIARFNSFSLDIHPNIRILITL
jgi:hypothetical protein